MEKTKETLGERISRLRIAKKLSQEKFGELAKIPRRTLQQIEYNQVNTSAENLSKIAKFLNVSEGYLIHGEGEEDLSETRTIAERAALLTSLYSIAPTLTEAELRDLVDRANAFRR